MNIFYKLYSRFIKFFRPSGEKEDPSSGPLSGKVRKLALEALGDFRGKLLDIGCGEGLFLSELIDMNPAVEGFGIDLDEEQIKRCRRRLREKKIKATVSGGDAGDLSFDEKCFDGVVAVNIFYNLPERVTRKIITGVSRVLKPGGMFVTDIRNRKNPFIRLRYLLAPLYDSGFRGNGKILKTYSISEIKKIAREEGLEVKKKHKAGRVIPSAYLIVFRKTSA